MVDLYANENFLILLKFGQSAPTRRHSDKGYGYFVAYMASFVLIKTPSVKGWLFFLKLEGATSGYP